MPWGSLPAGYLSQEIIPTLLPVAAANEHGFILLPFLNLMKCIIQAGIILAKVLGTRVLVSYLVTDFHCILPLNTGAQQKSPTSNMFPLASLTY